MVKLFEEEIKPHVQLNKEGLCLGGILYQEKIVLSCPLTLSLKTLNRHGLIAGATGTGKTKTIQMFCEQLSLNGVPSLVMDIKGDLSGLAKAGEVNDKVIARSELLNDSFYPMAFPVEFLSLGEQDGVKLRATLIEFGALLLAKMLKLNDTQSSILAVLFQYAKDNQLLLLDLADLKQLISYAQGDAKKAIEKNYGGIATVSLKAIFRKILELESQGGDALFGEPSFSVDELLQQDESGKGLISILRLMDVQDKPKLFSTFMLGLLTQVYRQFPEVGDREKPKLMLFIDEAHLIFANASEALLNKLETMVKLIRSKGVGIIFCTQSPKDVPEAILGQLGLKVQHALRAFTAKDRKAIKLIADNFPLSDYYDTKTLLTTLAIGQALVTALDDKGMPTPLVHGMIRTPLSRMGVISDVELNQVTTHSDLVKKYECALDRESAKEVLTKRMDEKEKEIKLSEGQRRQTKSTSTDSSLEKLSKNTLFRQIVRSITREITRAIMSVFGLKKKRGRPRKK